MSAERVNVVGISAVSRPRGAAESADSGAPPLRCQASQLAIAVVAQRASLLARSHTLTCVRERYTYASFAASSTRDDDDGDKPNSRLSGLWLCHGDGGGGSSSGDIAAAAAAPHDDEEQGRLSLARSLRSHCVANGSTMATASRQSAI